MATASLSYAQHFGGSSIETTDLDSWVDFNAVNSPAPSSRPASRLPISQSESAITSPASTVVPLDSEDFASSGPSHDYSGFRQQTGIPTGNLGLSAPTQGYQFDGFGSGLGMEFMENGSFSGMDLDMNTPTNNNNQDLPAFFFPGDQANNQSDDFVDPSAIQQDEPQRNIRFFPGMHQQQAQQQALARAQEQAKQLKQQQMIQAAQQHQHHQQRQSRNLSTSGKRSSASPIDARTEEIIGRVVNQIRQNTHMSGEFSPSPNVLPHVGRMKKDEEDMDEDERLLASEEGKKLSSKERRQLRNKVSARAFRSRRKEYIGQLEGEVAAKTTECNDLRTQNHALVEENARSRAFIEKLLRHPAFNPFLDELSRDSAILDSLPKLPPPVPSQSSVLASSQDFNTPVSSQPSDNSFMGMSSIPENSLDMSMLNLSNNNAGNGNNWNNLPVSNGYGFNQPQVFAVMELPQEPELPDFSAISGKGQESLTARFSNEEPKASFPAIDRPVESEPEFTSAAPKAEIPAELELYADAAASPSATAPSTPLFSNIILPAKSIPHFQLVISDSADEETQLMKNLERMCAAIEPSFQRVKSATESFGF